MKRLPWLLLVLVAVGALVVGVTDRDPATDDERARSIAEQVMCPACSGERVSDSQHPSAVNIRRQIAQRVEQGQSEQEIRDALAAAYGERVILNPPRSGVAGLVWVLPVAALVAALAGLAFAFRRWKVPAGTVATAADLEAAERARRDAIGS